VQESFPRELFVQVVQIQQLIFVSTLSVGHILNAQILGSRVTFWKVYRVIYYLRESQAVYIRVKVWETRPNELALVMDVGAAKEYELTWSEQQLSYIR